MRPRLFLESRVTEPSGLMWRGLTLSKKLFDTRGIEFYRTNPVSFTPGFSLVNYAKLSLETV